MVCIHGLTYEQSFKTQILKTQISDPVTTRIRQNFDNTAHPQQSNSWLWGRSVTHFQWYQFHSIHLFILKLFDTIECQNRTSAAGNCIVSAELESKSKNCWDFQMPSKEEWRQSHPTWICCSQQEKPERGTKDTPAPGDKIWGFIHTTLTWHEGPSRTCRGTSPSRCGNKRLKNQLLLFHNPQGLQDSLEEPQGFRAEVNSPDFMFFMTS